MVLSAILLAATLQTKVASVTKIYDRDYAKKLVPMLTEVISFPTTQNDVEGHAQQKAWLAKTRATSASRIATQVWSMKSRFPAP